MDHNKILGVVLAGGKSKRFGEDKSQVKLHGKILIDYILSEIMDQFNEILVVTNNPIRFKDSSKILTTKDFEEGLGPLGGILTAMKWIKDQKKDYEWISTFPSDTPFFTNKELKIFYENIDIKKSKLFFIKNKETRHNIFGLWSLDLLKKLETDLQKGERKVEVWADTVGVETINIEYEKRDPFFNINTKEDLEKAYKIMEND
ncbi:MAG: molybdenum cofactor guanylyltransferase [Pelagibacteraceae bacterium]|jgi:molybdopterin-guanine dinucleotide biosynthesis protein A|nr:molybdenum cofactor guanylyltransferase [Pelagibacteraceae bacterium]